MLIWTSLDIWRTVKREMNFMFPKYLRGLLCQLWDQPSEPDTCWSGDCFYGFNSPFSSSSNGYKGLPWFELRGDILRVPSLAVLPWMDSNITTKNRTRHTSTNLKMLVLKFFFVLVLFPSKHQIFLDTDFVYKVITRTRANRFFLVFQNRLTASPPCLKVIGGPQPRLKIYKRKKKEN